MLPDGLDWLGLLQHLTNMIDKVLNVIDTRKYGIMYLIVLEFAGKTSIAWRLGGPASRN